jgi:diketogulonate reductase-like aldo/keto reductase
MTTHDLERRRFLEGLGGLALAAWLPSIKSAGDPGNPVLKPIPVSGERLPAIGMGSWITFNVPPMTDARKRRVEVLRSFFDSGGHLVDSSPMYGLSESTIGYCLEQIGDRPPLFSATKVWIFTRLAGIGQMNLSAKLWGLRGFDLMQVHNMLDWEAHLPTLIEWKGEKRIRYIGITTSHGRRHDAMEEVIRTQPAFDFVQFSYSLADREVEDRLLPAAADQGKAVIINRPFRTGELFELVKGKPLPSWAGEIGCSSWSQFFLKFVISHPAVTCAIPATSRVDHMRENMQALREPLPDAVMRRRMVQYLDSVLT